MLAALERNSKFLRGAVASLTSAETALAWADGGSLVILALIAVGLAILVYILLWRTTLGYRIRAVGQNPHTSRYAGIKVPRYVAYVDGLPKTASGKILRRVLRDSHPAA